MKIMESRMRSMVKTVIYRIIIAVLLAAITWYYTGNLGQTTTISVVFNGSGRSPTISTKGSGREFE